MKVFIGSGKLSLKELAYFCRQIGALFRVGMDASKMVKVCIEATESKRMKKVFMKLYQKIQNGEMLSSAMKHQGTIFPPLCTYMVENGELSGRLDEVFEKMAVHYEKEVELSGKIKTAMIYPCILFIASIFSSLFLLSVVLPQFLFFFEDMELPWLTQLMILISNSITQGWMEWILLLGGMFVVWLWISKNENIVSWRTKIFMKLPVIGRLLRMLYTARFASAFSILYGSGIGILESVEAAGKTLDNRYIELQLKKVCQNMSRGYMLSECLKEQHIFLPIFISMVRIGEESGTLDSVAKSTGDFFQKEADQTMNQMIAVLEPCLILFMGLLVGTIVFAIMLPIFQMYENMLL